LIFVEDGANVDERSAVESIFMCDPFNFSLPREGIMNSQLCMTLSRRGCDDSTVETAIAATKAAQFFCSDNGTLEFS